MCLVWGFFDDAPENVKRKHKNLHYNEETTIMMILNMRQKPNLPGGRSLRIYYFRLFASLCWLLWHRSKTIIFSFLLSFLSPLSLFQVHISDLRELFEKLSLEVRERFSNVFVTGIQCCCV